MEWRVRVWRGRVGGGGSGGGGEAVEMVVGGGGREAVEGMGREYGCVDRCVDGAEGGARKLPPEVGVGEYWCLGRCVWVGACG